MNVASLSALARFSAATAPFANGPMRCSDAAASMRTAGSH